MKTENYATLSKNMEKKVQKIVFKKGSPYKKVFAGDSLWFTVYLVILNNIPMHAIVMHSEAWKVIGYNKPDGLLFFGSEREAVERELAETIVTLENHLMAA